MNVITRNIEKGIAFVSPTKAVKRAEKRLQMQVLTRKFEAASQGRRTGNWNATKSSVNQDLGKELRLIRARASDLSFNNSYAKKAIRTIGNNVVGTGIIPSFSYKDGKGNLDTLAKVKQAWLDWAGVIKCDWYGKSTFYGIQKLIMKTVARRGEAIVLRKRVPSSVNKAGFQIQVLTSEFLDLDRNEYQVRPTQGYIQNGVEYDKDGVIIAYWLYRRHPSEDPHISTRYDAIDVLHIFDVEEVGQNRGIPFGTSTVIRQRDLDEYEDAELVGKKIGAAYAGFVSNADPEKADGAGQSNIEAVEPGTINYLTPGESITFPTPPQNPGYSDYVRTQLRAIAAGYGITYEQLTGDLSGVNFSSGRMGWIESQREFETWQYQMLIPQFCDPVLQWFLEAYSIYNIDNINISWTPPRREMIDPVKEVGAMRIQARAGLVSWRELVKAQGWNPDDLLAEIIADQKLFEDAKLPFEWNPLFDPARLQVAVAAKQADNQKAANDNAAAAATKKEQVQK